MIGAHNSEWPSAHFFDSMMRFPWVAALACLGRLAGHALGTAAL
jgi:hypothetical protein